MDRAEQDAHNRAEIIKFRDKHGVKALERVREMMLERAESFPDRDRSVKWIIDVAPDGEISLDVRP